MRIRKVINRPVRVDDDRVQVRGGVNAVVAANVNEPGVAHTSSSNRQRIVQTSRRRANSSTTDEDKDEEEA